MKKIFLITLIFFLTLPVLANTDKVSEKYLKNKKHYSLITPVAENFAQKILKKSLKKGHNGHFDIKLSSYNFYSFKKGIFKYLQIIGKNVDIDEIIIPYLKVETITDYNWIDYRQNPIVVKTDINCNFSLHLTEENINKALENPKYKKNIEKVNKLAYPLYSINNMVIKIKKDKMFFIINYYLPLASNYKERIFVTSCKFEVVDGKIISKEVDAQGSYSKKNLHKIANLINLLDPLSFSLSLLEDKKCKTKIENIKIIDNIVQIDGKIYIKGEK